MPPCNLDLGNSLWHQVLFIHTVYNMLFVYKIWLSNLSVSLNWQHCGLGLLQSWVTDREQSSSTSSRNFWLLQNIDVTSKKECCVEQKSRGISFMASWQNRSSCIVHLLCFCTTFYFLLQWTMCCSLFFLRHTGISIMGPVCRPRKHCTEGCH